MFQLGKRIIAAVLLVALGCIAAFKVEYFALLSRFENATWDWRMKAVAAASPANPKIKIIAIDQSSLDARADDGQYWPWPRSLYVPILEFLKRAGARGVAFDLIFSEHQSSQVDEELAFAASIQGPMPVVLAVAPGYQRRAAKPEELNRFFARQQKTTLPHHKGWENFTNVTLPVPELLEATHAFGSVTAHPDADGVFRHAQGADLVQGRPVLTLPFALFVAGASGEVTEPLSHDRLIVRFSGGPQTYETFSFEAVLQSFLALEEGRAPSIALDTFKDALVFVGGTAPGILDLRPVPLAKVYPGVEFNASVLGNLLGGNFITPASTGALWWVSLVACTLVVSALLFLNWMPLQLSALVAALSGVVAWSWTVAAHGVWLPMVAPLIGVLLATLGALALRYQFEGKQGRFIKRAFKQYVSPAVIERIVADPGQLALGGVRRDVTVFFSDLVGFTKVSEGLEPTELVALLNDYLTIMSSIVLKWGGTIDKYVGDAVVAFWNAPLEQPDHASRAVQAALECQARMAVEGKKFEDRFKVKLKTRIGINTGPVVVGNIGSRERFNYTVIGDGVNLASRLEGANKFFGTDVLISGATRSQLSASQPCRRLGRVVVVGKSESVEIFEPLQPGALHAQEHEYARALELFESASIEEALRIFKGIAEHPRSGLFLRRLEVVVRAQNSEFSPDWRLEEK